MGLFSFIFGKKEKSWRDKNREYRKTESISNDFTNYSRLQSIISALSAYRNTDDLDVINIEDFALNELPPNLRSDVINSINTLKKQGKVIEFREIDSLVYGAPNYLERLKNLKSCLHKLDNIHKRLANERIYDVERKIVLESQKTDSAIREELDILNILPILKMGLSESENHILKSKERLALITCEKVNDDGIVEIYFSSDLCLYFAEIEEDTRRYILNKDLYFLKFDKRIALTALINLNLRFDTSISYETTKWDGVMSIQTKGFSESLVLLDEDRMHDIWEDHGRVDYNIIVPFSNLVLFWVGIDENIYSSMISEIQNIMNSDEPRVRGSNYLYQYVVNEKGVITIDIVQRDKIF